MTDRYAVIGNPIEQSKSPLIHAEFARACGQTLVYERILGPLGGFAACVDAFRSEGGLGLNVTAPFKLDACAYCTELSLDARLAGAVNAMKFEGRAGSGSRRSAALRAASSAQRARSAGCAASHCSKRACSSGVSGRLCRRARRTSKAAAFIVAS